MLDKKRIALAVFIAVLAMPFVFADPVDHVVISEVYYDPLVTEAGGECLELYNPGNVSVDIGGWVVMTESSATDATVPSGTIMPPNSFYLIADTGWSSSKDNSSWPDADHEEPISMTNSDSGVALAYPNATIIDAVGWGDPINIDLGLYEGTPALEVAPGSSLLRSGDTDNNSADISSGIPNFKNSEYVEGSGSEGLNVSVTIENSAPVVEMVIVLDDEDPVEPGVQISPLPGSDRSVEVTAVVSDQDGTSSLNVVASLQGFAGTMDWVQDVNATTAEYSMVFDMPFYVSPGNYSIEVNASDSVLGTSMSTDFEYLSMTAISIDATDLSFAGATLGASSQILGDLDPLSSAPTVRNIGNTHLDLGVYGTDLSDGANKITVDNLKYSFDNDFDSALSGTLSSAVSVVPLGLSTGQSSMIGLGMELFVPEDTQNGNYSGEIFLAAVGG